MANVPNDIPEDPSKNWFEYYRFRLGRDTASDARNTLLVVAVLIAAATFQAGVNPPGGVWQESKGNYTAGKAILGVNTGAYSVFLLGNSLAFSASINIITYLVLGCPFQLEVLISIYAMSFTYGASIAAVQPEGAMKWEYIFVALMLPYFLKLAVEIIKKWN